MRLQILPVYVSSTWLDLKPERGAVEQAVNRLRETKFVGMEYFGSRDETTRQASLDDVDRSRIYVCIVAGRYGSGITEAEYERASELGLPRFIYFKDDATIPGEWREQDPARAAKLDAFRKKLRENHLEGFDFKSPDDLAAKVTADLHRWLFDQYLTPKLRGALGGEVSRAEAQALLDAVKDLGSLKQELLDSLRGAGFNVASGERAIAFSGDKNQALSGDDNVVVGRAEGDVVKGDKIVYEAAAPLIPTLHQLRAPVGDFVGRGKEIDELLATLRGGGSAAITGISGMGGIGKTELAFYVAERLRDVYPDAQLVVDMRGTDDPPRDPSDALAACIRAFVGLEQRLPDDLPELTRIYRSVLEGKRALILLDNASDGAQARPLLPPPGSALLVTSRNVVTLPRMTRVTLEQLSPAEARELLTSIAPRVPDDTADRICFLCGYLPLALRAAGSLLDVTADLKPSDYAEQLQDERRRLELIGTEGVDLGVEASFGLSYARLSPAAARVFRQVAAFPADFDAPAEETVCEDPGHKHLTELLRRNLVIYDDETRRYHLHDLTRLFADSRLSAGERSAGQMHHAEQYLIVLRECSEFYLQGGESINCGLSLFDQERRNIEAGQAWACQHSVGDEVAARLCNEYPNAGVYVLLLRQHPREGILWREAALVAARKLKDRASEGRHLHYLGVAYKNIGKVRCAVEYYEKALVIAREVSDRRNEAATLDNLGNAYNNLGQVRRAVRCHKRALAIEREIGHRRGEGQVLANLGNTYAALGKARRAIEFYERALAILQEVGDRRSEGETLDNLGNACQDLGKAGRAIKFHQRALAILREIGDQRGESFVLGNLGNAYVSVGETARALELFNEVLIVAREIDDQYSESNALYAMSLALNAIGSRAQAIVYAEVALEIYERIESPYAERVREQLAEWRGEA